MYILPFIYITVFIISNVIVWKIQEQRIKYLREQLEFRNIDDIKKWYEEREKILKSDNTDKGKELEKINKACLICMDTISELHRLNPGISLTSDMKKNPYTVLLQGNEEVKKIMNSYEIKMTNLLK